MTVHRLFKHDIETEWPCPRTAAIQARSMPIQLTTGNWS